MRDTKALRDEATRLLKEDRKRPQPGVKTRYIGNPHFADGGAGHGDSYVYIIGPKKTGPYKVGHAKSVPKRLAALQTGSPVRLRVWGAWRCPEGTAREVEQAVHKRLDWARVYGEWFDIDQPALRQVVTEMRARTLLKHGVLEVNGVMMEDTIAIIAADENGEE
jgi:hypothetical protein